MVVQSPERAIEPMDHLFRRPINRLHNGRGVVGDSNRLMAFEPRFHHAAFVIASAFAGVLVSEMHIQSRDMRAEAFQCAFDGGAHRGSCRLVALDVAIGIDLDLHSVS